MQPDSSSPAAATRPSFTFNDDMCTSNRNSCARDQYPAKRHDSVNPIIVKIGGNSSAQMLVPRCGRPVVSFLPQVFRLSTVYWAGALAPPNQRHASAVQGPQMCIAG